MEEFYVIAGTVRSSATLDPIAGAQVTLVERDWFTQTDQEGHFRFSEDETGDYRFAPLDAGSYTLHVSAAAFAPQDKPITVPGVVLNEYDVAL